MDRKIITPAALAAPKSHYSHGVVVSAARTLYVSGQVPLDPDGNLVGVGDPTAQAVQALENVRQVVEAAGGRIEDIAKTTIFLSGSSILWIRPPRAANRSSILWYPRSM